MVAYTDGNLTYYCYGDVDAPAGAGKGKQYFPDIRDAAIASGKPFSDPLFPPNSSSFGPLSLTYGGPGGQQMDIRWMRIKDISQILFSAPPTFEGTLNEYDVNQGLVGDCWFLAVMADIALKPKCFNRLVPADNSTSNFDIGVFHFRMWCRGKWVDVVVDDMLPVVWENNTIRMLAFCEPSSTGGFWPSLLEKAYAKMYSTYFGIKGGFGADAMLDFTGGYIKSTYPSDPSFVQTIRDGKASDMIMSIGTLANLPAGIPALYDPDNPGQEDVSQDGMVMGHEYSVLDIQDQQSLSNPGQTYTLIRLRNPWGNKTVWNKAFSGADPNNAWGDVAVDLRKQIPDQNKGEFWIQISDLVPYVQDLDTCRWSIYFSGDKAVQVSPGLNYFVSNQVIAPGANSGSLTYATDVQGKGGFYVHLKPVDPNQPGDVKNGYTYNCSASAMMIWSNYTQSSENPDIPIFGLVAAWAPGYTTPTGPDFFNNVLDLQEQLPEKVTGLRRFNKDLKFPAGTLLLLPWMPSPYPTPAPYDFRILAEGDIFAL